MSPSIHPIIQQLDAAADMDEIWSIAEKFFSEHKVTHLIYVYCRDYINTQENTILLTNLPDWWIKVYHEKGYARSDPFFTHCCQTYDTIRTGVEYFDDYDYLNSQERNLIIEGSKTGFKSGTTFIMRRKGSGSDFGGWNIGTALPRNEFEALYEEKGEALRQICMYVHEQVTLRLKLDQEEVSRYQNETLTKRQVDCLSFLSQGLRTIEIANKLNIQPVTVEHHLKLAKDKLQATTREQAVARAIIKGLVKAQ